ncbi:MAG TPA: Gfo/Idh/MocA family oxidoreductase [Candidatus Latescibacteria bacterium]|nr:Gfo/Idh/MocA family oxidoreductase [Candidatus Latescibacterota bacterium]
MKHSPVNVAVIGIGNMGRHHARVYSELEDANLVAVSDLNSQVGEQIASRYGVGFYHDYRKMIERDDIDAVSIAVPTSLHTGVALACIETRKSILIEKPIADSLEDACTIVEEAGKKGVIVAVGHIERFNPAVLRLKEVIEQGRLNSVTLVIARRVGMFPPQVKDANVIIDLAVHDIDVCNFLLGKRPGKVYARAGKALNSKRADFASIFLDYDGTDVLVQANWITPVKIRELNVTGTRGYAELNYITQKLKVYESNYERGFDFFGDFVVKFGAPDVQEIDVMREEPLKVELGHFISCVRQNTTPLVSGKEGIEALEIALAAVRSYKSNQIVELCIDPDKKV